MRPLAILCALVLLLPCSVQGEQNHAVPSVAQVPLYHVMELSFSGPELGPADTPQRDVELSAAFRHESGEPAVRVHGFWDGDGRGGSRGNVFKVRFTPTKPGRWTLVELTSNRPEFKGQHENISVQCVPSKNPGFWIPDGRWYRRSDGSHPLIVGNTHYTFLTGRAAGGKRAGEAAADLRANAPYYKKVRFSLLSCRYPDPELKSFFDDRGQPSDDGRFSLRANPAWFAQRVDPVIRQGFALDVICDLILCGPDTAEARAALVGDPRPWLRYVAARYGAFPNVWVCLGNEWDIKQPHYQVEEIVAAGQAIRSYLPYDTPVSVHGNQGDWKPALNGAWTDHVIIQNKIKELAKAASAAQKNFELGGNKPVANDENAYQGAGDRFSREDTVEGCLGTFLGGGYPTTGEKPAAKVGQYFWGGFDADVHTASPALGYLREYVDREVNLARLAPAPLADSPLAEVKGPFALLAAPKEEYLLGTNRAAGPVEIALPPGTWRIVQVDLLARSTQVLAAAASGRFPLRTPDSRAVITHFKRLANGAATGSRP